MCPLVCWCMGPPLRWVEISGSILKILKGIINLGMPEKITKFFSFNWNISSYRNVIKVETVSGLSLVCLSGKMFWAAWHWCTRRGNVGTHGSSYIQVIHRTWKGLHHLAHVSEAAQTKDWSHRGRSICNGDHKFAPGSGGEAWHVCGPTAQLLLPKVDSHEISCRWTNGWPINRKIHSWRKKARCCNDWRGWCPLDQR